MTLRQLRIMNEWFGRLKYQTSVFWLFAMYYIIHNYGSVWAIPTYRVYRFYDSLLATSYGQGRKISC